MRLVPHLHYINARSEMRQAIANAQPGSIIFIVGPPGSGKTTIRRDVMRDAVGNPAYWGTGRLPAIEVFAMLPQNAYFSSLSFARDLYQQLFAPDLDWLGIDKNTVDPKVRCLLDEIAEARTALQSLEKRPRSEGKVWEDFVRSAPLRALKWVCVDQASAMCINHRDKSAAEHILHLMSVGERCGLVFILTGIQKVASLWATHSEVVRRSTFVWVPTYSHHRSGDLPPFLSILRTLSSKYHFTTPNLIRDRASEILFATGGSYGLIEKLFLKSSVRAKAKGHSAIHLSDIEESFFGDRELRKLWEDIEEFDELRKRTSIAQQSAHIRHAWGLPAKSSGQTGQATGGSQPTSQMETDHE
jgi:hypothetical protein